MLTTVLSIYIRKCLKETICKRQPQ